MISYGDPGQLDDLARRLDRQADDVVRLGDEMVHRADAALWTSIAADAYRELIASRHRDFDHVAWAVRHAAREVRHHANTIRHEMALIAGIERHVRDFLSTLTEVPSWALHLPSVGDVAWRGLGHLVPGWFK